MGNSYRGVCNPMPPEGNGQIENFHSILKSMIKTRVGKTWSFCLMAYRSSVHTTRPRSPAMPPNMRSHGVPQRLAESHLISIVLNHVADRIDKGTECRSTEDMIAAFEDGRQGALPQPAGE